MKDNLITLTIGTIGMTTATAIQEMPISELVTAIVQIIIAIGTIISMFKRSNKNN